MSRSPFYKTTWIDILAFIVCMVIIAICICYPSYKDASTCNYCGKYISAKDDCVICNYGPHTEHYHPECYMSKLKEEKKHEAY